MERATGVTGSVATRLRRPKMAVVVAEAIVDDIVGRDLDPGVVLATESQMIERFGVGRNTLREALRLLESEGVIAVRAGPNGGAVVQAPSNDRLARLLSILLTVSGTTMSEVIEARLLLEPELARRAAVFATDDCLERMEAAIGRQHSAADHTTDILETSADFHSILAEASRNRALTSFWAAISRIVDGQQIGVDYGQEALDGALRAHRRIFEAIRRRDPERAGEAMRRHLLAQQGYLQKAYPHLLDARVRVLSGNGR